MSDQPTVSGAVEQVTAAPDAHDEIEAMAGAYEHLKELDPAALYRVMNWLRDRLNADHAVSRDEEPF